MGNITPTKSSRPARRRAAADRGDVPTSIADALLTTTQQRVLALLFGQPSRSFYSSELIELTRSGSGAVQRELKRLWHTTPRPLRHRVRKALQNPLALLLGGGPVEKSLDEWLADARERATTEIIESIEGK